MTAQQTKGTPTKLDLLAQTFISIIGSFQLRYPGGQDEGLIVYSL